ncbi:MAG TPA: DNA-3-methyladenine glycosylase [Cytophagaceae bacterium]|jgi:DNA-3-methyladenine glycosylase|nr:DNA-3-methyladenine glycosylase [Cytophagaceae bacterium]
MKLAKEFYLREDVLKISKELLGKFLFTNINGKLTGGIITETEAYKGIEDKASHAYGGKRTVRTETFYKEGGISYVYLCYGIHSLFNVVTNSQNIPHAILIRAIEPVEGIDFMLVRRNKSTVSPVLTCGPGSMSQALGIRQEYNQISLQGDQIWIEDRGNTIKEKDIVKGPRIGVDYAEEYAAKPWRFGIKNSRWVSKRF